MKLKAPENSGTHVSHAGIMYEIKNGVVEVPDGATELFYHGFKQITDEPKVVAPQGEDKPAKGKKGNKDKPEAEPVANSQSE